jgi:hypothetical protein
MEVVAHCGAECEKWLCAMSLVLKLKTGDAALQAAPLAGETMPGVLPPPEPALLDWATLTPTEDSHLAPCPHCGLPNGLSASTCWNCEADLLPLERLRRGRPPRLAAPAPDAADESLPVLTSAVERNDLVAELSIAAGLASTPVPAADRRRPSRLIGASILVVAAVAVAAFVYLEGPAPPGAAKSGGFVDPPEPAALMSERPPATPLADAAGAGNAPPAVAETPVAALRAPAVDPTPPAAEQARPSAAAAAAPIDVATRRSPTQPTATAALKAAHAGKARHALHPSNETTELAVPRPNRPEPAWQAPAPVRAACTPTVAALGLCTAPPTPTKE